MDSINQEVAELLPTISVPMRLVSTAMTAGESPIRIGQCSMKISTLRNCVPILCRILIDSTVTYVPERQCTKRHIPSISLLIPISIQEGLVVGQFQIRHPVFTKYSYILIQQSPLSFLWHQDMHQSRLGLHNHFRQASVI